MTPDVPAAMRLDSRAPDSSDTLRPHSRCPDSRFPDKPGGPSPDTPGARSAVAAALGDSGWEASTAGAVAPIAAGVRHYAARAPSGVARRAGPAQGPRPHTAPPPERQPPHRALRPRWIPWSFFPIPNVPAPNCFRPHASIPASRPAIPNCFPLHNTFRLQKPVTLCRLRIDPLQSPFSPPLVESASSWSSSWALLSSNCKSCTTAALTEGGGGCSLPVSPT